MKYYFLAISFLFTYSISSWAQSSPEQIEHIAQISKGYGYYNEQAKAWRQVTTESPKNETAWFNYFYAARYANQLSSSSNKPFDLKIIIEKSTSKIASTFEYNYMLFLYTGDFEFLIKSDEIGINRYQAIKDMVTYYKVKGNEIKVEEYCQKWYDTGKWSPGLLKWNYNALIALDRNSFLLTWGDNDTYPAWLLQEIKKWRKDIHLISAPLLNLDEYRAAVFTQNNIPPFPKSRSDFDNFKTYIIAIIEYLQLHTKKSIYLGIAGPIDVQNYFESDLFLVGLSFKLSKESFDNIEVIKDVYENKLMIDYLKTDLEADQSQVIVNHLNLNYLPSFLLLHEKYKTTGALKKVKKLESLIHKIAEKGGRKKEIIEYLNYENTPTNSWVSHSDLRARDIDRQMGDEISDGLYANSIEVSNEQYELFLIDLVLNKEFGHLDLCKTKKTNWLSLLSEEYKNLSPEILYKNSLPDSKDNPVQNISWEAANLYCEWMTMVYNTSKDKKKHFKKVLIRLPSESEWELAAKGGYNALYPYGKSDFRNLKGCYLFNSNPTEKKAPECTINIESLDGAFFTTKTHAYFPNNFGLYNASGNVAEMTLDPTITKGGSWIDSPIDCQISKRKKNTAPAPTIGFRIFMEVIEE